ncbi:MAG: Ig-like domain-containing protein, partial [Lachnospiraceae bacterium]|nr:Ig-like domain-containing protein [Lachnospiraceae bacterium]
MFKRKLFKRALPVILSVAMIFQSMPATALAAENETTEVVETTVEDSGSESDAGDEANEPANEEPEAPAAEQPEASAPAQESKQEEVSVSTEEAKQEETSTPAESTTQEETSAPVETAAPETTGVEEEATDEDLQQAEADEVAAAKIIVDEEQLKSNLEYGLKYEDGVVSGSYNPDAKIFDSFVNDTLKDVEKKVISIKVGDKADDTLSANLKEKLSFQWNKVEKQEGAEDKLTPLTAGETPKDAGVYRLVLSLEAVDGLCGKAEDVGIDFEIKQAVLKAIIEEKPEIGTKLTDFVNSVKENYTLSEINNNKTKIVKDLFVKDTAVLIKDAITGTDIEITDVAVFEKGKDYSYTLTVTLNDDYAKNYVVEDFGNIVIEVQGDVETQMEITPLKNIEYTYNGKAIEFPVAGTDYTVKVTYTDEETKEPVAIENPVITPSWLDADGNKLDEAPVDAGSYQVLLVYSDTTGRYASCEEVISVKINPVSVYIEHSLSKEEYADQTKEADVLKNVKYKVKKQADDTDVAVNNTFWGVSYNDEQKTQSYEPIFELQAAKLSLAEDGKPLKDEAGNPVYGAWSDNGGKVLDGSKVDGVNQYKYRVVFSGKKGVRWSSGNLEKVDINDRGTNSAENNYSVDVSEKLIGEKAVDITVAEAATVTIDISAYEGKTEKIYDGNPFEGYETRSGYKKAKVPSGELTYEWYESIGTETTLDSEGKEHTEYIWSDDPVYEWNVTYPEPYGTKTTFSPVNAGVYKLLISYNDPTGVNTARDAEVIHIIHRQKVKAEIGTGTEAQEFVTYSGVKVSDFKAGIEESLTKAVKPAIENDLNKLGEALGWEYGKDYDLEWFIQRKDNLTEGNWIDVDDNVTFDEGDEYTLSVGVKINPGTQIPDNLYDDNYQSYDTTAEGVEYYKSNVIPIKVEKMGTTPISVVIDNEKITQTTRPYNGEAFAIPTDAVSVFDDKTGDLITDIQLKYIWKNSKEKECDAVNAGIYKLYVSFEGNGTYAPLKKEMQVGTQFEITQLEIGFKPYLNSQIVAGSSAIQENVADSMELVKIDPIPESEIADFTVPFWINDAGNLQKGYKAFKDFDIEIKTADGEDVPYGVLKSNTAYYAEVISVDFRSPYDVNYKPVYLKTDFTAERAAGYVGKAGHENVPATSLKDTIDGLSHTIMPREGVAYTSKAITTDDGKTLSGNFFVFEIQAPREFYWSGSPKSQYVGEAPVFENSLKDAKGYRLSYDNGKIIVAFEVTEETKTKQKPFQVRWEDGFVEEYTVDFTNAVLEADLRKAVAPKSIAFNNPAKKMVIGEKQQLDVKVTKKQLDDIICLRYETDNEDVLSVSDTGAVVAIQAGSANVKAIPCYLDNDGKKVDITGAKAATAKITVVDVTAPKIKGVAVRDTWATVTYPALADGYRREIYVVEAASKVTADQIESQISNIVNGDWRGAGFACAPIYTASENVDSKNIAGVEIHGLKANTAYVVYVRNVSGVRTLSNGKTVALSYKGAVKNFKTTLAEVQGLAIEFEEKYEDAYEYNVWRASLSEKKIPTITNGCFVESATNPAANVGDLIWHVLPFAKGSDQAKYCAQPKLSYYVTESASSYATEPTGLYTLKIGEKYYRPTTLAKVDKKGTVTLNGVGTVYVWVYDAVTDKYDNAKLYITAEPTKFTLAKSAKVKVGASICLGDYATYYDEANKKVPGNVKATLVIEDISGDEDSFAFSTAGVEYDPVLNTNYYDTYITAKEANKRITLKVKATLLGTRAAASTEASITITSSAIDSVKNLKVSDVADRYATYSFTYPASALRLWDRGYYDEDGELWVSDSSDTTSVAQLYFRVQVLDAAKKVVSDTYINPYIAYENSVREYNAKAKTYTFKGQLEGLNRKSSYTMSVTAVYLGQTQDQTSKAVSKGFKTTDIPAAYQREYGGSFYRLNDKDYKTADGGIAIGVGNGSKKLKEYPALTSNNTYTLIAYPDNPEAKNRLTDTLTWKSTNTKVATVKANAGSYTATLKALRKGTTQIEVTSKVTKRIIARWTVYVNATGEATYYYGDWEPDEDINFVHGIEYGDLEFLTIDNQVQATLASGEGKIAKFVAPAYGEYTIQSFGLNMMVYTYDEISENWQHDPLNSSCTKELHENEVCYIVVKNLGSEKSVKVRIQAYGTTYSTLTMDGFKKTDSRSTTMVFTAPEDNVYTFTRDNKLTLATISLNANETGKISLPYGTYEVSVSKREPAAIDMSGKEKETIGAGATNWYVFEAPSAMEYTFATTTGTLEVYSAITDKQAHGDNTHFLEAGKKVYISVKNSSVKDITSDITIKSAAQIG